MDNDNKIYLYYNENGQMDDLVRHANELLLRRKSSVNGNNDVTQTPFPKLNLINEIIQSEIIYLQLEVTELQETISVKNNSTCFPNYPYLV